MLLNNYLEQHESIREQVMVIETLIKQNDLDHNANQIALDISHLAGVIKIHLSTEDKLLYPVLLKHTDENVRNEALAYQNEMGSLLQVFTEFKDKYNTKTKIHEHSGSLQKDLTSIVTQLNNRMKKEENGLYQYI